MNANVVSGVGREDQGPLPEALMAHTVTETVYLGRASFRITHEMEAVGADDTTAASAEWFSHDSTVILKGGPNGLALRERMMDGETDQIPLVTSPTRGGRRSWLLVAVPLAAFALGIGVASIVGSSASRRKAVAPVSIMAPVALPAAAAVSPANPAAAPAAPPSVTTVAIPATAAPAVVPTAALPPSTVALTAPVVQPVPAAPVPDVEAEDDAPAAPAPHVARPAVKPRVARKVKADHARSADTTAGEASDDATAPEASTTPAAAPKKAAVKWVDPWAN